jgi:hypothetical protein
MMQNIKLTGFAWNTVSPMFTLFADGQLVGVFSTLDRLCEYALSTDYTDYSLKVYRAELDLMVDSTPYGNFIWGKNAFVGNTGDACLEWISEEYSHMEEFITLRTQEIYMIEQEIQIKCKALDSLYNLDANNIKAPCVTRVHSMILGGLNLKSRSGVRKPLEEFIKIAEKDLLVCRYIRGELADEIERMKGVTGFQGSVNELLIIHPDYSFTPAIQFHG